MAAERNQAIENENWRIPSETEEQREARLQQMRGTITVRGQFLKDLHHLPLLSILSSMAGSIPSFS